MSLENYFKNGWLKKEATSPQEIADQLGLVDRNTQYPMTFASIQPSMRYWISPILHSAPAAIES